MNKAELIDTLRQETVLSRPKAKEVVELFFDRMSNALASGDRVEIRGLWAAEGWGRATLTY